MRHQTLAALLLAVLATACRPGHRDYVDFLYASMPLPDSLVFPREYWEENVAKKKPAMSWNWK